MTLAIAAALAVAVIGSQLICGSAKAAPCSGDKMKAAKPKLIEALKSGLLGMAVNFAPDTANRLAQQHRVIFENEIYVPSKVSGVATVTAVDVEAFESLSFKCDTAKTEKLEGLTSITLPADGAYFGLGITTSCPFSSEQKVPKAVPKSARYAGTMKFTGLYWKAGPPTKLVVAVVNVATRNDDPPTEDCGQFGVNTSKLGFNAVIREAFSAVIKDKVSSIFADWLQGLE